MAYLVLEIGTGLVDGWYTDEEIAERMRDYWDDERPRYTHITLELVGGSSEIPDEMYLGEQPPECNIASAH